MCNSVRSFHHKSVSSYSYNSIPLYFVLFFLICTLRSSLHSFAHCIRSPIFFGIYSFCFFASSSSCIRISSSFLVTFVTLLMFSTIIHFCDFANNLLRVLFLYSILHFQALRKSTSFASFTFVLE